MENTELWLEGKKLVGEMRWKKRIGALRRESKKKGLAKERKELCIALKKVFVDAIKMRIPEKKFGILLSGGVDSSAIAAVCRKLRGDFICYAVGFQDKESGTKHPDDVLYAQKLAKKMGLKLRHKIYDAQELEKIVKKAAKMLQKARKSDVVSVSVGSVIVAAVALARKDGIASFFSGLGSEEIFAGYERHGKADDVNEECWHGLKEMWRRDLLRDATIGKALGISVATPFLDEEMIKTAMCIPGRWKIDKTQKKIIFREAAEKLGVPKEFAWRKKQAAQYGSCFDKGIEKLAKRAGFKEKGEYVRSLV